MQDSPLKVAPTSQSLENVSLSSPGKQTDSTTTSTIPPDLDQLFERLPVAEIPKDDTLPKQRPGLFETYQQLAPPENPNLAQCPSVGMPQRSLTSLPGVAPLIAQAMGLVSTAATTTTTTTSAAAGISRTHTTEGPHTSTSGATVLHSQEQQTSGLNVGGKTVPLYIPTVILKDDKGNTEMVVEAETEAELVEVEPDVDSAKDDWSESMASSEDTSAKPGRRSSRSLSSCSVTSDSSGQTFSSGSTLQDSDHLPDDLVDSIVKGALAPAVARAVQKTGSKASKAQTEMANKHAKSQAKVAGGEKVHVKKEKVKAAKQLNGKEGQAKLGERLTGEEMLKAERLVL